MGHADRVTQLEDLVISKLHDPVAGRAVQMIVSRITIVVLKRAAIGQTQLAKQPGLNQKSQGPVNRRPADVMPGVVEVSHQFIGVEVFMGIEDVTNQHPAGLGELLVPDFQKCTEFLDR